MGRIAVLPDTIASRIAAGEVVERPASAMKELIENAIDAGARSIDTALVGGGRDAITVTDDGEGMSADDLLLALERHATSKIRQDLDIEHVRTLGFRGEAVPAIASVSRFRMTSRDDGSETASVVEIHGGRLISVEQAPGPRGTRVEVGGLFYNAPARRKFLRTADTERQRCVEVISRLAIGYPEIRFRLSSEERLVFDHAPVSGALERCAQVFGRPMTSALLPVRGRSGDMALTGLCSGLGETRAHARDQHVFVNRRPVRDRLLSSAISAAYAEALPRGRYPVVILLLDLPPELVDVNVHPAKSEVRFRKPGEVREFVLRSIQGELRGAGATPALGIGAGGGIRQTDSWPAGNEGAPAGSHLASRQGDGPWFERSRGPGAAGAGSPEALSAPAAGTEGRNSSEVLSARAAGTEGGGPPAVLSDPAAGTYSTGRGTASLMPRLPGSSSLSWSRDHFGASREEARRFSGVDAQEWIASHPGEFVSAGGMDPVAGDVSRRGAEAEREAPAVPLGQFLDSYILAAAGGSLLLVDQHAAHERILFEKIARERGERAPQVQRLLDPVTIELSASEKAECRAWAESLTGAGFEAEPFGEGVLLLRGVPAGLDSPDPAGLVREVLSDLRGGAGARIPGDRSRRLAATIACHAAIKVRFPLTASKMAWLLDELFRCETPTTCPHGRPAILRIGLDEIERGFHRR